MSETKRMNKSDSDVISWFWWHWICSAFLRVKTFCHRSLLCLSLGNSHLPTYPMEGLKTETTFFLWGKDTVLDLTPLWPITAWHISSLVPQKLYKPVIDFSSYWSLSDQMTWDHAVAILRCGLNVPLAAPNSKLGVLTQATRPGVMTQRWEHRGWDRLCAWSTSVEQRCLLTQLTGTAVSGWAL